MRKSLLKSVAFLVILIFGLAITNSQAQKESRSEQGKGCLKDNSPSLPSSLDAFYPPSAEQPIYLFKMMELGMSFMGILADLFEEDHQNAKANFEKFKSLYLESSKMVPEWEKDYPQDPQEELDAALQTGDRGKIMVAYGKTGNVCHECHVETMVKVQQKYHWQDFKSLKVKDPLTGEVVDYSRLMQGLAVNFMGIIVDVQEGQGEQAQRQFQGFKERFQAMEDNCEECHGAKERKYYVDRSVEDMVTKMGEALNGSSIDPQAVQSLFQAIGKENCFNCHLVHLPAAYARH